MKALAAIVLAVLSLQAAAVDASNRYRSPRNPERKIRQTTELIVLHTTEAPARSSLNKVSERGECHFCVTEEGQIYRIVDRDREAFHAGRSMWNGKEDVDKFSIGIECVGQHDKEMSIVQLNAIRDLVKELKSMYNLTDDKVVCHSHVAYGVPNKWQKKKHRGRKRCGMLFAMPSVRRVLDLKSRPAVDMDVRKRRLVVGDPYLEKVLYGRTDTMVAVYQGVKPRPVVVAAAKPVVSASQKAPPSPQRPSPQKPSPQKPSPQKPSPQKPATPRAAQAPSPGFKTLPTSVAELRAQGYVMKGSVSKSSTAAKIAGSKWNSATTYYTIRNKVIPGNMIDQSRIEVGMCIWMKP